MSQADRAKWDARYGEPVYRMGAGPRPWLRALEDRLPTAGQALDLAAGEGQTACFLARRGLTVTAADISEVGLAKALELAQASGVSIATRQVDLEADPFPAAAGTLQLLTCLHFLDRALIPEAAAALAPGGILVWEALGTPNLKRHPHPSRRFLAEPEEMLRWFPSLTTLAYDEGWRAGIYVCRLMARRQR